MGMPFGTVPSAEPLSGVHQVNHHESYPIIVRGGIDASASALDLDAHAHTQPPSPPKATAEASSRLSSWRKQQQQQQPILANGHGE
jgi:hypothetical protein